MWHLHKKHWSDKSKHMGNWRLRVNVCALVEMSTGSCEMHVAQKQTDSCLLLGLRYIKRSSCCFEVSDFNQWHPSALKQSDSSTLQSFPPPLLSILSLPLSPVMCFIISCHSHKWTITLCRCFMYEKTDSITGRRTFTALTLSGRTVYARERRIYSKWLTVTQCTYLFIQYHIFYTV